MNKKTSTAVPDVLLVRDYFLSLQAEIVSALESVESGSSVAATFSREDLPGPDGTLAQPRVMQQGGHLEKAAVQFTHSRGEALPPAATERNPAFAGHPFQATAISLIVHPRNPYAPTTHMNLRFFIIEAEQPSWYFGGGFDLTPYYGFVEDVQHWHQQAAQSAKQHYEKMKADCDTYFYLPHRQEPRGVGGLFFDDWNDGDFQTSFDLVKRIGDSFLPAYLPILKRRLAMPYEDPQRQFQLLRRGRYAEFNLALDRGTKYGLQSGRRVESVLASLPPQASWEYQFEPELGSPEAELTEFFLQPRDWLKAVDNSGD